MVQVLKACYGLTNAPRRWYEKVKKDQESRGWYACKLEPCLFTKLDSQDNVIGLILVHVDDFQITGDYDNKEFRAEYEHLKKLYRWGIWKSDEEGYSV